MTDVLSKEKLEKIEEKLNYSFENRSLLKRALTHSSISHRGHRNNERLEFLGDSILEAIICEYLFHALPNLPEGRLSEIRSVVVSTSSLTRAANRLQLDRFCRVSRGIQQKEEIPKSIKANLFEAVIAAIYLDGNLTDARTFVLSHLEDQVGRVVKGHHAPDYKSLLQQYTQKRWNRIPDYRITSEDGPDHNKQFEAAVLVRGERYGPGRGSSKQEAEQEAARIAVEELDVSLPGKAS